MAYGKTICTQDPVNCFRWVSEEEMVFEQLTLLLSTQVWYNKKVGYNILNLVNTSMDEASIFVTCQLIAKVARGMIWVQDVGVTGSFDSEAEVLTVNIDMKLKNSNTVFSTVFLLGNGTISFKGVTT